MSYPSKITRRFFHGRSLALLAILGLPACTADLSGPKTSPIGPGRRTATEETSIPSVAAINILPGATTGAIGESAQFVAMAQDAAGNVLPGQPITWQSADSTIATVTRSGYATAVGVGPTALIATAGAVSVHLDVTVTGTPIAAIGITAAQGSAGIGETVPLTAILYGADGGILRGRPVVWSSSAPTVVMIDAAGRATVMGPGTVTLRATSAGKTGLVTVIIPPAVAAVATVTVTPGSARGKIGQSRTFTAVVKDAEDNVLTGRTVTWSSTNTAVVAVTPEGYATAMGSGSAALVATVDGTSGQAAITVMVAGPDVASATTVASAPDPGANAEPAYVTGVGTLLWRDTFDGPDADAAMRASYRMINGEQAVHVDATAGTGDSGAIRFDWNASNSCKDDAHLLERSFPASQDVYIQYSVRYSAGFTFDWTRTAGRCKGNAKKLFFLWAASGSRFDFISENHWLGLGSDNDHPLFAQNAGPVVSDEMLGDGQWHRITIHVRQSSTPTAKDGFIYGWIDGVLRWSQPNVASNASGGWVLFKLPTTFNQGSPVDQSEWVDDLTIWRS